MMMWQIWWIWALAGVILAMLEVALPGFILLGFAIGSGVTALLMWLGVLGGSLGLALLVCALAALAAWWVLRTVMGVRNGQVKVIRHDINDN